MQGSSFDCYETLKSRKSGLVHVGIMYIQHRGHSDSGQRDDFFTRMPYGLEIIILTRDFGYGHVSAPTLMCNAQMVNPAWTLWA